MQTCVRLGGLHGPQASQLHSCLTHSLRTYCIASCIAPGDRSRRSFKAQGNAAYDMFRGKAFVSHSDRAGGSHPLSSHSRTMQGFFHSRCAGRAGCRATAAGGGSRRRIGKTQRLAASAADAATTTTFPDPHNGIQPDSTKLVGATPMVRTQLASQAAECSGTAAQRRGFSLSLSNNVVHRRLAGLSEQGHSGLLGSDRSQAGEPRAVFKVRSWRNVTAG
jgi:hypothetical protein